MDYIRFGPEKEDERRAKVRELYPLITEQELEALLKEFNDAHGLAWELIDEGYMEKDDEAAYARVQEKFPWLTKSAQDYIVVRMHYYYHH